MNPKTQALPECARRVVLLTEARVNLRRVVETLQRAGFETLAQEAAQVMLHLIRETNELVTQGGGIGNRNDNSASG